jgi:uncharacterized protein YdhG (YjbR/CyaY superfamily)
MQSKAANVAAYIAEAPAERQAVLKKLRSLCRAELKGAKECMDYGMPCYKQGDVMTVCFASQKQYIALYGCGGVLKKNHPLAAAKLDCGKGCIRFKKPGQIDFTLLQQLLQEKQASLA